MDSNKSSSHLLLPSSEAEPFEVLEGTAIVITNKRSGTSNIQPLRRSVLTFILFCLVLFNIAFLLRGFLLLPSYAFTTKFCSSRVLWDAGSVTSLDVDRRSDDVIHVAFFAKYAFRNMKVTRGIDRTLNSILEHTKSNLHFHVILDVPSKKRVYRLLRKVTSFHRRKLLNATYYDVDRIVKNHSETIEMIRHHFFNKDVGRYNNDIFFMSEIFHRSFPSSISRIIFLDVDLKFQADIAELWNEFSKFKPTNVIGIAPDLQPQYRMDFARFRLINPDTAVGSHRPGRQGFNTGVTLFDLHRMRESKIYNSLLNDTVISELCGKYQFDGYLGHQDFFTLTGMEYPELYYDLDCSWNRQLDTGWLKSFPESIFNLYHSCEGKVKVFHGNGDASIPGDQ